jgi:hypothetical protein
MNQVINKQKMAAAKALADARRDARRLQGVPKEQLQQQSN